MDVLAELRRELAELEARGLRRVLPPIEELAGPRLRLRGRWLLNLSSNDYLGLAQRMDPEEISREVGSTGAGASRLLSGNHPLYQRLEEKLVALYGRPALVFSSGYTANLAILSTLCGAKDVVFADKLVHASLIDGLRLSGAAFHRYAHLDLDHLERLLARHRSRYKRALIVTESVFSMDGDVPDLARLVELKERYQALLFVDEAHAVGVFGKEGLGIAEELSLIPQIDLLLATFGKALGSYGAFLVTHPEIRDYLVTKARPFIFTTGLPPLVVAASLRG
ncbi:MAG: 8-amino-7-oxononanoate synthase, partial [Thermodesulfobacteria bacterium]|nr:8-amino-7-oxononanoate synthase [Thermodesulfobacteriota bacterium]